MNTRFPITKLVGASMILMACSLLLLTRVRAATVVSGNVSGTWTTNQSPYILTADCTVVSNQTLTIQPGVTVIIGPNVTLRVDGGIVAVGTPEQPIAIQGANPSNYWNSIDMGSDGIHSGFTNRFHYCRIRDGYFALQLIVAASNRVMVAEILNCDFLNCINGAVLGEASGYAGDATLIVEIHNCVFDGTANGCVFVTDSVGLPNPGNGFVSPHVTGNIFKNLTQVALDLLQASPSTNSSKPVFMNNIVVHVNRGVAMVAPDFDPLVRNNLFVGNFNAMYRTGNGSMGLDASYNSFFGNTANFVGYPGVYGIPIQNNHNGDPCDAFFNIFLDPQVLDTNRFLLSAFSPCIDAGDPAIADVCFQFSHGSAISDIGAYGGPDACGWLTHGFAPVLMGAMADQSSCVGASATFKVRVEGSAPFSYRWYFNGSNLLAGETNAQLNLVNLQTNQAGFYTVAVSNVYGSVTSAPARLLVFDACVGINLYAGLSITGMVGRTYAIESATNLGATNWTLVATNTFTTPRWLFIDTNTPFNPGSFVSGKRGARRLGLPPVGAAA